MIYREENYAWIWFGLIMLAWTYLKLGEQWYTLAMTAFILIAITKDKSNGKE